MFTKEQQQRYLEDPEACPNCNSRNLVIGQRDFCGDRVYQNVVCRYCGREWQEVFTLTSIEESQF